MNSAQEIIKGIVAGDFKSLARGISWVENEVKGYEALLLHNAAKKCAITGITGPPGAGKSTLLKMLNGLIRPDEGKIEMRGKVGALIELGAGFSPILTGRENIYNNGAVLGFSKEEVFSLAEKKQLEAFELLADELRLPRNILIVLMEFM